MHRPPPPKPRLLRPSAKDSGFSLVEVSVAIAIIAFAFVALFGLLPIGMQVSRTSIDATNENWIVQDLHSMVQVSEWKNVINELSHEKSGEIFYYDEEGRLVDTENEKSADSTAQERRLYAAKLLIEPLLQPTPISDVENPEMETARRVIVVLVNALKPTPMKQFENIKTAKDVAKLTKASEVRARAFIVTKMDSASAS